eukprot:scaffold13643_cov110-Isochrysis_galbana.AAC.5
MISCSTYYPQIPRAWAHPPLTLTANRPLRLVGLTAEGEGARRDGPNQTPPGNCSTVPATFILLRMVLRPHPSSCRATHKIARATHRGSPQRKRKSRPLF